MTHISMWLKYIWSVVSSVVLDMTCTWYAICCTLPCTWYEMYLVRHVLGMPSVVLCMPCTWYDMY